MTEYRRQKTEKTEERKGGEALTKQIDIFHGTVFA